MIPPSVPLSGSFPLSPSISVDIERSSRIRSSPAKASVIWVPMLAICTNGPAIIAVRKRYITKSPSVMSPPRIAPPPITIITTAIEPTITDEKEVSADTPVIDLATLRRSRCAPRAKTRSSFRSEVNALTMRTPAKLSPSRPVTSALIRPRSRKSGLRRRNAKAMAPPKRSSTAMVKTVSCQFK